MTHGHEQGEGEAAAQKSSGAESICGAGDSFSSSKHRNGASAASAGIPNGWNGTFVDGTDPYALKRDCNASSRLTAQHYLWKDLLGFLLHSDIPSQAPGLRVADVATGNGIWLHDFARGRPSSMDLHGFDVSLDQVGAKTWAPANIKFHTWNIFDEPPSQFVGYFDVVHVRLITVVVTANDPRPILSSIAKLLKPGGYLQWDEVDTIGCSIKTVPGMSATCLEKITSQLRGTDTWKYDLTDIMEANGYSNAKLYTFEYGLDVARFWTDVYISTWKEFADNMLKMPEVTHALEQGGLDEARRGAATMVPKLVWVARKA